MAKPTWDDTEELAPSFDETDEVETYSELDSGARGLAQGATLGFADEISGGVEALWEKAKGDPTAFGELYKKARDESRANFKAAQEANPLSYTAGEIGGAVGTAFIPGMQAASGAKLAAVAGRAALAGGVAGLGTSEADLTEGEIGQAALDTAKGAALGGVMGAAAQGAGKGLEKLAASKTTEKVATKVADKADEIAEMQAARALGAERGTIKKLGKEKVREIGRYALDEVDPVTGKPIVTAFANTDDMIARNEALQMLGGEKMDEVYTAIDEAGASTFNPLDTAVKVDEKIGDFWRSPINRGETNQLENTIESMLMRGDKPIPLREAQVLKEELGKVANWKNNVNITDKERMAREAYHVVSQSIDEATQTGAEAIGKGGLLKTLQEGKKLYGSSKGAEDLLNNRFAREQGNKMFGLTDTITGAAGLVGAVPTGGTSLALAPGAVLLKKGVEKYGSQLSAVTADRVADAVRKSPQLLGKFSNVMQKAAQRGPQAVAATHFLLQQQDPAYREQMKAIEESSRGETEEE